MNAMNGARPRSLAATRMGQSVAIKGILFSDLRAFCRELGLHEGDMVRCRFDGLTHKILEAPSGRTIVLEQEWARYIQVGDPEPNAP